MTGAERSNRLLLWAILSALILIAVFWYFRVVLAGTQPPGFFDVLNYYYPQYRATFGALGSGELPLWNPYQLAGVPWLPALQVGAFYPPHIAYVLIPTGLAMGLVGLFHFLLAGGCMVLLAWRLRLCVPAAILAASMFTMRGSFSHQSMIPNSLEANSWIVAGSLAVIGLARGGGHRSVLLLAAATSASILAGYPQATVYSIYLWGALLSVLAIAESGNLRFSARAFAGLTVGIAVGVLISSVTLVPVFEHSGEAVRGLGKLSSEQMFPLGFEVSFRDAFLGFLRSRNGDLLMSFGIVGVLLLPFAFVVERNRILAIALAAFGLLAIAISLGPVTPIFDLYLMLPTLDSFRNPRRILVVSDFCFAVLVGLGLHGVRHLLADLLPIRSVIPVAITICLLGAALFELFAASPDRQRLPYFNSKQVQAYSQPRDAYATIAQSGKRVLLWNPRLFSELPPKIATLFRMRSVDDYEPMSLRRQSEYFTYLYDGSTRPKLGGQIPFYGRHSIPQSRAGATEMAKRQRLLDLAGVDYVLVPGRHARRSPFLTYAEAVGLLPERTLERKLRLWRNPGSLARAFVTYCVLPAPEPDELLAILSDPHFDPYHASYVEGEGSCDSQATTARGAPARIVLDESAVVEIEAELKTAGFVVLADSYHPDWRVTVDGLDATIFPTNHLFRGVPVPAGRHTVRFEFRPASLAIGGVASLVGLVVLLGIALASTDGWRSRFAARRQSA